MIWVVDTCLVLDVLEDDRTYGESSARLLDERYPEGLILCPVSYIELGPAFGGDVRRQEAFLDGLGVDFRRLFPSLTAVAPE